MPESAAVNNSRFSNFSNRNERRLDAHVNDGLRFIANPPYSR